VGALGGEGGWGVIPWSFLRADDITAPGEALDRLAQILATVELPCLLAVIPLRADQLLPPAVEGLAARSSGPVWVAQHGTDHRSRASPPDKDELGPLAAISDHLLRLVAARRRLRELFPGRSIGVYVPPWNAVPPRSREILRRAGYPAISGFWTGGPRGPWDAATDLQKSYRPPSLCGEGELSARLASHPGGGILLHPSLMTDDEADRAAKVLRSFLSSGLVRPPRPDEAGALLATVSGPPTVPR
jgi:hypothetical protein